MTHDLVSLLRDSADECPAMPPAVVDEGIRRGQMLHRRRRRAVLAGATAAAVATAVVVVLASGVTRPGEDPSSPAPADDLDSLPVVTEGDEVLVSCGGGNQGWPPSVMAEGVPGLLDQAEATRTFQNILDDPQWGGEAELTILRNGVDVEWRVLRGDSRSLVIGLGQWTDQGPARRDAYVLSLERQDDRWIPTGWGGCSLAPILREGNTWAQVTSYRAAGPDATSLQASVSEVECTGARDPGPFLHEPTVVEGPDAVTVYWTSTPIEGGADCPGNPILMRVIELDAPIGDRQVLDGSRYPPQPVELD